MDTRSERRVVIWQRIPLALCAGGLLLTLAGVAMLPHFGFTGVTPNWSGRPFVNRIMVEPDSSASRSGLRSGNLVDVRGLSSGDRYRWFNYWTFGQRMGLPVLESRGVRNVSVLADEHWIITSAWVASGDTLTWDYWLFIAGFIWMLFFAALISSRRPDSAEARLLALVLILAVIGGGLGPLNWITPWAAVDAWASVLSVTLTVSSAALFAAYAMLFARPISPLRKTLAWLSYVSAAAASLYNIIAVAGAWTGTADPLGPTFSGSAAIIVQGVLPWLLPLLCVFATIAASSGAARQRVFWAAASLGTFFGLHVAVNLIGTFSPELQGNTGFPIGTQMLDVSAFIAPLGLTYSILNKRLLDVGFALNRAAVFTGVSLTVVGLFVLVEWAAERWIHEASPTLNITVTAGLALLLGLSVRAVHFRIERLLDNLLFRKRHEDIRSINAFAWDAGYITDAGTLLERTIQTLERYAEASVVNIVVEDRRGGYGNVSANDVAIIRLRAQREAVDLREIPTDLAGDRAYPMVARGRLVGAIAIGPKRSGESYAPDESYAIAQLSHAVGLALDVLFLNNGDTGDGLIFAIKQLSDKIETLSNHTKALQQAISEHLPSSTV